MIYTDLNNLERYLGMGKHLDTAIHYIKKLTEILHLSTALNMKHYQRKKQLSKHMRNMQISIW